MSKRIAVVSASLILVACGGGDSSELTINDVRPDAGEPEVSRIAFNPGDGVLPLPNDLLFSGTQDGTLEPPDEAAAKEAGDEVDLSNPGAALGGVDGWSTQMPMQITVDLADGATLDATTVGPTTVLMIETDCGLGGMGCTTFTPVPYGPSGYVAVPGDGTIAIFPAVPLNPKTTYIVALTNGILDSRGTAIAPSAFYEVVTQDPSVTDIENETLGALQDAINGYESIVFAGTGGTTNPDDMIFTASWTTGSAGDAVASTAAAVLPAFTPTVVNLAPHPLGATTMDINPALSGIADVYLGSITLPYFLGSSTAENPLAALEEPMTALCDNGVLLSQADPAVLATLTPGDNDTTCQLLGLRDFGLDTERYLTQYNPVAATTSVGQLEVILTVPNAMSGQSGPFPIAMYQHGIGTNKETVLAFADAMALAGYAVIAIDLPLHNSRGFDLDGDDVAEIEASADPTAYMNLANLLTAKGNFQQSILDLLGMRMALNNALVFDGVASISDADFDRSTVEFVGMSLGAMVGTNFLAQAAGLGLSVDSAALVTPAGGIVPLLFSSANFGEPVIFPAVLASAEQAALEAGEDLDITDPRVQAEVLGQFAFAAQTIVTSVDPNNFAVSVGNLSTAGITPVYAAQVNDDFTIPNRSSFGGLIFGGTQPVIELMGLIQRFSGDAPAPNGYVKFTDGSHGSFLTPNAQPIPSLAVTIEMQTQVSTFIAGDVVVITDPGVVE